MVSGCRPLVPEILGQTDSVSAKKRYSMVATSRNIYQESSVVRKSTTRFPVRLRRTAYVAPKPHMGDSKTQRDRFSSKIWTI